jgi:hypothetical protein
MVMNRKQIEQHVPILGWLHLVGGAFFVAIGLFMFTVLSGISIAVAREDPIAPRILILVGTAVCTLLVVLGLPGIVAGYGLLKRRPWARGLAIVVGVLSLFNVPIGTAIGIYTLLVLMPSEATDHFVPLKPA